MKIVISPAKKMNENTDSLAPLGMPRFLPRTKILMEYLKDLSFSDLKTVFAANDKIVELNRNRLRDMDLEHNLTPAILSYEGIQYQYMAPSVLTAGALSYIEDHLRILSGFYGVLRPFDGVTPYRLEMQAKISAPFCKNLYGFWGSSIYESFLAEEKKSKNESGSRSWGKNGNRAPAVILNLASAEYARALRPWLTEDVRFLSVIFGELAEDGSIREKGVYVKMARGEMVRFLAENKITDPAQIREFDGLGYRFSGERSREDAFVFIKKPSKAVRNT